MRKRALLMLDTLAYYAPGKYDGANDINGTMCEVRSERQPLLGRTLQNILRSSLCRFPATRTYAISMS